MIKRIKKFSLDRFSEIPKFAIVMFALTYFFMMALGGIAYILSYYVINSFGFINWVLGEFWLVYVMFIISPFLSWGIYLFHFYEWENNIFIQPDDYVPKVHYIDHMVEKSIEGDI